MFLFDSNFKPVERYEYIYPIFIDSTASKFEDKLKSVQSKPVQSIPMKKQNKFEIGG
jgi:hypothetical protein